VNTDPQYFRGLFSALNWSQYSDLSECQFRLRYSWSQGGKVTIHSSGISMPFAFTPDHPQFNGIAVQLEVWQQGDNKVKIDQMRQHLNELAPVEFYLEAIKGPGSEHDGRSSSYALDKNSASTDRIGCFVRCSPSDSTNRTVGELSVHYLPTKLKETSRFHPRR